MHVMLNMILSSGQSTLTNTYCSRDVSLKLKSTIPERFLIATQEYSQIVHQAYVQLRFLFFFVERNIYENNWDS